MQKRGQLSIFIVLAVIVLGTILISSVLYMNKKVESDPDTARIKSYLEIRLEEDLFKCIKRVSEQGGYNEIPLALKVNQTAYWYYENVNTQPFLSTIEEQIQDCLNTQLAVSALEIKESFGGELIQLSEEEISANVSIVEDAISAKINFPITLSQGGVRSFLSYFEISVKINFLSLYQLSTGIVNYATSSSFDQCSPIGDCSTKDVKFTYFRDGERVFIRGQTYAVLSNKSNQETLSLNFAIYRPIKNAFGSTGKKAAVLYQDDENLITFGGKAIETLKSIGLNEGVDYFDCSQIDSFIERIDDFDVIVITGYLQRQIVTSTSSLEINEYGNRIYGCDEFNSWDRKKKLKNWVNNGGSLYINSVGWFETDEFIISYIGSLGYSQGKWITVSGSTLAEIQESVISDYLENRKTISEQDIIQNHHPLLTCPHNLVQNLSNTWRERSVKVTTKDEIIIGNIEDPVLWVRPLGDGVIVFDQFLIKDNLLERLEFNDDIYSKGIAEEYYSNVINYLLKFKEFEQKQKEITLVSPQNGANLDSPIFIFNSELDKDNYELLLTNHLGETTKISIEETYLTKNNLDPQFTINLKGLNLWEYLNDDIYEWQIISGEFSSDIGYFIKLTSLLN